MPDFKQRRKLARLLNRNAAVVADIAVPDGGWIHAMRNALSMSAENVAVRKGVSRNAVYQAERSEKEGAVSLKQMERLADAMGGTFVYAIVPNETVEGLRYQQAFENAQAMAKEEPRFDEMSTDEKQDWMDDVIAEQLHDMPSDFWDTVHKPEE